MTASSTLEDLELSLSMSMRALAPSKSVFVNVWSSSRVASRVGTCCDLRDRRTTLDSSESSARGPHTTLQHASTLARARSTQASARNIACSATAQHDMVPLCHCHTPRHHNWLSLRSPRCPRYRASDEER